MRTALASPLVCLAGLVGLAVAFFPEAAHAQVNIERLRGDLKRKPVFLTLEGNLTGRTGNVESIVLGASLFAGGTYGKHLFFLKGQADYGRFENTTTVAKTFIHARYNYELSDRIAGELFAQAQRDDFRDLRLRNVYGAGPRFRLIHEDWLGVYIGTAYMLEYELLDVKEGAPDQAITWNHRWSNYASVSVALDSRTKFSSTLYVQPRFDEFSDVRVLNESTFSFQFGKRVSATISAQVRFDSEPPTGIKSTDLEIKNGIALSF
jgi:hypothetical protein